jgi:sugar O-acyltransferase (sialic acid O-acetyltransferase NeuD family)
MDNIVIIGASGHAKVVIDVVRREGRYNIAGLLDQSRRAGDEVLGCRVLGKDDDLPGLTSAHSIKGAIVAIGDNFARSSTADRAREICPGLKFVSAVHPRATIATDVSVGEGAVVMAGVVVNPGSSIGRFCILNTNSTLDHDSTMDDYSSLAPGALTGGNCRVGRYSAISIGAVLAHGVQVGEHSVIGAASLVTKPVGPFVVAYGTPAKEVRSRRPGDEYL